MTFRRIACIALLLPAACGVRAHGEGWFIETAAVLRNTSTSVPFNHLECRTAALNKLSELRATNRGDYECGRNCEYKDGMGDLRVCEVTER